MPDTRAPSPAAYMAHVTPFDVTHPSLRRLRLSARQVNALTQPIPIALTSPSPFSPVEQANLQIQDATARILKGRAISAVLYQGKDAGDVSIWDGGEWLTVARAQLVPAQRTEVAA